MDLRELMQTPIGEYVPIKNKPDCFWRFDNDYFKVCVESCSEKRRIEKVTGVCLMLYTNKKDGSVTPYFDFLVPFKRAMSVWRILSGNGRKRHKRKGGDECGK